MKADKIREFLEWAYGKTQLSPKYSSLIKELEELERLATIGKATEKALQHGYFIYDIVETWEGKLLTYNKDETIEEFLKRRTK